MFHLLYTQSPRQRPTEPPTAMLEPRTAMQTHQGTQYSLTKHIQPNPIYVTAVHTPSDHNDNWLFYVRSTSHNQTGDHSTCVCRLVVNQPQPETFNVRVCVSKLKTAAICNMHACVAVSRTLQIASVFSWPHPTHSRSSTMRDSWFFPEAPHGEMHRWAARLRAHLFWNIEPSANNTCKCANMLRWLLRYSRH